MTGFFASFAVEISHRYWLLLNRRHDSKPRWRGKSRRVVRLLRPWCPQLTLKIGYELETQQTLPSRVCLKRLGMASSLGRPPCW